MRAGRLAADALSRAKSGQVVSVHRRAANLMLEGGAIVSLLPLETPLHPWAVAGALDPDGLHSGDTLQIDVRALEIEDLSLRSRPARRPSPMADALAGLLSEMAPPPEPWTEEIDEALAELGAGQDAGCLARLVGLGGGLTPSGDDVIVGALAALDLISTANANARSRRRRLAEALPQPLGDHTPRLSAQMITAAIDGQYPEPLLGLCEALTREDPSDLQRSLSGVLALGHSSGWNMLRGFLAGVGG